MIKIARTEKPPILPVNISNSAQDLLNKCLQYFIWKFFFIKLFLIMKNIKKKKD